MAIEKTKTNQKKICTITSLQRASQRDAAFLLPAIHPSLAALCTDCTSRSKKVGAYGLGEFCRSGTKVDDLLVLHVQISGVPSQWSSPLRSAPLRPDVCSPAPGGDAEV